MTKPPPVEPKRSAARKPNRAAVAPIVSIKVTLNGVRPAIWRRIILSPKATLRDLHHAIQAAMGWMGGHLHVFDIDGQQYGDPFEMGEDVADELRPSLDRIRKSMANRFSYTYDFGDNWEHTVLIEKRQPAKLPGTLPACVAGARNCPPEDCGGIWGYGELLEILADPKHPEYVERAEFFEGYDPEAFSVEAADARLAARLGRESR